MLNNFFNLKKILKAPSNKSVEIGVGIGGGPIRGEDRLRLHRNRESGPGTGPRSEIGLCPYSDEEEDLGVEEGELGMGPGRGLGIGPRAQAGEYLKGQPDDILDKAERFGIGPLSEIGECRESPSRYDESINDAEYLSTNNPDFLSLLSNIKNQLSEIMSMIPKLNSAIDNNEYIEKSNNLLDNILNDLSEDMYPSLKNIEYDKINDIKEKIYNLKEILHSITPQNAKEDDVYCVEIVTPQAIGFVPKFMNIFKDILHHISDTELSSEYSQEEEICPICGDDLDECDDNQDYPSYENIEIINSDDIDIVPEREFDMNKIIVEDMNSLPFGENPFAEEMVTILADLKIAHGLIKQSQKYNNVSMDSVLLLLNPTKYNYIDEDVANDLIEIYADISDNVKKASMDNGLNKVSYLINDDRDNYRQEFYISDWHPTETRKPNIPYNYQYWLEKVGDTHHKVMARLEEQKNPINKIMALRIPDGQRANPIRKEVAGIETRMMRNDVNTSKVDLHNIESRMHGRNNKEQIITYAEKPKTSPNFNNLLENKRNDKEITQTEGRLDSKRKEVNKYNTEGEINKIRDKEELDFPVYEEMLEDYRGENVKTAASALGSGIVGFDSDMWGKTSAPISEAGLETNLEEPQEYEEYNAMNEVSDLVSKLKQLIKENDLDIALDMNISLNDMTTKEQQSPEKLYNNTGIEGKLSQEYANTMRDLNTQFSSIDPNSAAPDIHMGNQMAEAIGAGAFDVPVK